MHNIKYLTLNQAWPAFALRARARRGAKARVQGKMPKYLKKIGYWLGLGSWIKNLKICGRGFQTSIFFSCSGRHWSAIIPSED